MSKHEFDMLSDSTEATTTRFVTFIGESYKRFDLAIMTTNRFYGKKLITDLQSGISAIVGEEDIEEEGYLEYTFKLSEEEAGELRNFLSLVVGPTVFTD
ncbi:cytosolic protein [Paenibacillus selenitireducens]|jgi:hypothetical protein|uniref:Cytosolic protein n=1 Tax=Paenibacillus selenitireducens TaxID=1324314 RepID=A0A1T2XAQ2_9BACL|nr:DUF3055 domain-containing protein [Paenibacillus selenitireducens]OPA76776.1 cytosolic protein [Paenibacillus selenitireducens]